MQLPASAISGLEAAVNRYLRLDPETGPRLAALSGRIIEMALDGLDLSLFILPDVGGIRISDRIEGEPDTVLRGTPLGMMRLGLGGNTEQTLFSGDVVIEGDVETGAVANFLSPPAWSPGGQPAYNDIFVDITPV